MNVPLAALAFKIMADPYGRFDLFCGCTPES